MWMVKARVVHNDTGETIVSRYYMVGDGRMAHVSRVCLLYRGRSFVQRRWFHQIMDQGVVDFAREEGLTLVWNGVGKKWEDDATA